MGLLWMKTKPSGLPEQVLETPKDLIRLRPEDAVYVTGLWPKPREAEGSREKNLFWKK